MKIARNSHLAFLKIHYKQHFPLSDKVSFHTRRETRAYIAVCAFRHPLNGKECMACKKLIHQTDVISIIMKSLH